MNGCEYCKNVDTGDDFNPIVTMMLDFGVFSKADVDVDLVREMGVPKLMVSITPDNADDSLCKSVPIKFCPMCGRELSTI